MTRLTGIKAWSAVVDPVVEAWRNDRLTNAIEEKYDRWYVESASCRLYAERLLENLRNANSDLQFAAHTDATGWPANSYWRLLAHAKWETAFGKEIKEASASGQSDPSQYREKVSRHRNDDSA